MLICRIGVSEKHYHINFIVSVCVTVNYKSIIPKLCIWNCSILHLKKKICFKNDFKVLLKRISFPTTIEKIILNEVVLQSLSKVSVKFKNNE